MKNVKKVKSKTKLNYIVVVAFVLVFAYLGTTILTPQSIASADIYIMESSRELRFGHKGKDVRSLKRVLTWLEYFGSDTFPETLDNEFDKRTEEAVRAYQKSIGVRETGIADQKTLRNLRIWAGQPIKGTLVLVGDSMSKHSRANITRNILNKNYRIIEQYTVPGTQMVNTSEEMFTTRVGADTVIDELIRKGVNPDNWIFILGTNDVSKDTYTNQFSRETTRLEIKSILDRIQKKDKITWVNVYGKDRPWTQEHNELENTKIFNGWLNNLSEKRKNMNISDWYTIASRNPDRYLIDTVHVKPEFRQLFADTVVSSLE